MHNGTPGRAETQASSKRRCATHQQNGSWLTLGGRCQQPPLGRHSFLCPLNPLVRITAVVSVHGSHTSRGIAAPEPRGRRFCQSAARHRLLQSLALRGGVTLSKHRPTVSLRVTRNPSLSGITILGKKGLQLARFLFAAIGRILLSTFRFDGPPWKGLGRCLTGCLCPLVVRHVPIRCRVDARRAGFGCHRGRQQTRHVPRPLGTGRLAHFGSGLGGALVFLLFRRVPHVRDQARLGLDQKCRQRTHGKRRPSYTLCGRA